MIRQAKKAVLLLFLLLRFTSYGQTIYEIKYSFNKLDKEGRETSIVDKEYDALLFYDFSKDINTMRVRYYDADKASWIIVEQKVKTLMYAQQGKQYWALAGSDPIFISKVPEGTKYYPDRIILNKNPDDKYYSPAYVISQESGSSTNYETGKLISFNTLVKPNVTNEFLSLYGWKWPENKDNSKFDLAKSTLYLIQVTNSLDEKLGTGFSENHKMIKKFFSNAAQTCNINFKSIEIMGYNFNKTSVSKAIADFTPSPNDIVIFYYSGHGYRYDDQTSQWPRMLMVNNYQSIEEVHANSLSLDDDVYKPLSAKGAHLLLVFGECCNKSIGPTPTVPNRIEMLGGDFILDPNAMKALFKQSGQLLLATSKPNEYTWYYPESGGIFGQNFVTEISREANFTNTSNKGVTWKDIIDNSIKETVATTGPGYTPASQDPIRDFNIK